MEYLFQKVSYLQGLAEGLDVENESKEGKLILHIIDILGEFADVLDEVIDDQVELEEYVNYIDEDLADMEEDVYGDFEEDYEDDFDFDNFIDCCDDEDCECYQDDEE